MENMLVRTVNIHKWFGKVHALNGVDFDVGYNEVVGLVGDNGAGKSTLIKILSGVYKADEGEIYYKGERVKFTSPSDARKLGIETVYQEQALATNMNIPRNIFMGREVTGLLGLIDMKAMMERSGEALENIGLHMKRLDSPVRVLSGGERQGVAIARPLYFKAGLVVLDEPTIALSVKESQQVLAFMERLKKQGVSVIFISHNLHHVFPVADRFVILTHGEKTADAKKEETSIDELEELIISGRARQ